MSPGHQQACYCIDMQDPCLPRVQNKMANILQTPFSNAFSWKKDTCIFIKMNCSLIHIDIYSVTWSWWYKLSALCRWGMMCFIFFIKMIRFKGVSKLQKSNYIFVLVLCKFCMTCYSTWNICLSTVFVIFTQHTFVDVYKTRVCGVFPCCNIPEQSM